MLGPTLVYNAVFRSDGCKSYTNIKEIACRSISRLTRHETFPVQELVQVKEPNLTKLKIYTWIHRLCKRVPASDLCSFLSSSSEASHHRCSAYCSHRQCQSRTRIISTNSIFGRYAALAAASVYLSPLLLC